jgi:hypothetical protein
MGSESAEPAAGAAATDQVQDSPKPVKADQGDSFFNRYRPTSILLVLFITVVALAFFVYPRRPVVSQQPPISVHIQTDELVQSISIGVRQLQLGRFSLEIEMGSVTGFQGKPWFLLVINLPVPVTRQSCERGNCSVLPESYTPGIYGVAVDPTIEGSGASTILAVDAPVFAWDANSLDIEAELPQVQVVSRNPRQSQINPNVTIAYTLPRGYDWTGAPTPFYLPDPYWGEPTRPTGALIWQEKASDLANPVPVSGTDNSTASWDSYRIFISGALLGIAGGALVGAVTEVIHTKRRTAGPSAGN